MTISRSATLLLLRWCFYQRSRWALTRVVRALHQRAMGEIGIDTSRQSSKTLDRFVDERFDHVITVCDDANESCPVFPNATHRLHWSLPDPSKAAGTKDEQLGAYRAVRDELRARIHAELLTP